MKILTLFFLILFFHSAGQVQTIKIRKQTQVNICGQDTGIISVDTILKNSKLIITPLRAGYKIKGFTATINDDIHMNWTECRGDKFCADLVKEIIKTDRNKMTLLRVFDIVVLDKNNDTVKVNSIGLLLK